MTTFDETLEQAFKARLPLLYVETSEEMRLLEAVARVAGALRNPRTVWTWTASVGLSAPDGKVVANTTNPVRALDHAAGLEEGCGLRVLRPARIPRAPSTVRATQL